MPFVPPGGGKNSEKPKPRERHPKREIIRGLARFLEAQKDTPALASNPSIMDPYIRGLSRKEILRTAEKADVAPDLAGMIADRAADNRRVERQSGSGFDLNPVGAFAATIKQASRPVQGVESMWAEWSRQAEQDPIKIGPISLAVKPSDPGEIWEAGGEGFMLRRHDSPATIAAEAGKIRESQGRNTKSFGVLPGTDLTKAEVLPYAGKAGTIAFDVGGGIALDPFTVLTFGTGAAARGALGATRETLGAARAAEVAQQGVKVLTAEERARLGVSVVKALRGAKGGVGIRLPQPGRAFRYGEPILAPPRTVLPGTKALARGFRRFEQSKVGTPLRKIDEGLERVFVPRAGVKQAERAGDVPEGTAVQLESAMERYRGAANPDADIRLMRAIERDAKLSTEEKQAVAFALSKGTRDELPDALRPVYDRYDEWRRGFSQELRDAKDWRGEGLIPEVGQTGAAGSARASRLAVKAREAAEAHRAKNAGVMADAEFLDVPSISRPGSGELGPSLSPASDVGLARKVGKIVKRQEQLDRRAAALERRAGELADMPVGVPDEMYYPEHVQDISKLDPKEVEQAAGDSMRRSVAGRPSVTAETGAYTKRRTSGLTLEEKAAAGQPVELSPSSAYAQHAIEGRRDIAARGYMNEVLGLRESDGVTPLVTSADDWAVANGFESATQIPDGELEKLGLERVKIPKAGEFVTHKMLAPELKKVARLSGAEDLNWFLRGMDRWMSLWKGYATVPLPFGFGFHMRNGASNVMLNWLADISPTDPAYMQAFRIQRRVAKGMKEGAPYKYLNDIERHVAEAAMDRNVWGGAFFIEDIPRDPLEWARSGGQKALQAANPLDPNNVLIRSGRAVGLGVEENARLAHFISKWRQFGSFDEAAASMRRYLFDYGDLTAIERDVFKRIIPFYTFTRKNTPLWVAAAFKTPGKYSRLYEWRQAFIDASGRPTTEVYPEYLDENAAVPLPTEWTKAVGFGDQRVMLSPDLPPAAAGDVLNPLYESLRSVTQGKAPSPEPWFEALVGQAGGGAPGLVKAGTEAYLADKDFFTGGTFRTDKERFGHVLQQAFPLLPKVQSAIPTDEAGKERQARRLISMLSGVQLYPIGPYTKKGENLRRSELLSQFLAKLRAAGYDIPQGVRGAGSSRGGGGGFVPPGG